MKAKFLIVIAAAMIVFASATAGVFAASGEGHKTYITDKVGEKDINSLRENGCEIMNLHKKVASVSCPDAVAASMNLREDIKVYALDIDADMQIGADAAWGINITGTGSKVAVVDTGIDYTHPELSDSFAGGWNEIANNNNTFDDNGHGTHVSGIITANGGAAKGVAPDAQVLAFKVLDSTGSGSFSNVLSAVYDAVDGQDGIYGTADDYNPDAISMSLGTAWPTLYTGSNCDSAYPEMASAVAYANSRGVAVVAAAGNDARGVSIPGCISGVITVGAVNDYDVIASFSGVGGSLDVMAPGVGINSTTPGNSYASWDGTSMATPMVSAVVALLRQAKPNASVSEITSTIYTTAKDLGAAGWDKYYGYGRVNASAAIAYILPPVPVEPVHDVAVASISAPSSAAQGTVVPVTVAVTNAGNQAETFSVALEDINASAIISSQSITLSAGASQNVIFQYNTSASFIGDHVLKAEAVPVAGENNTANNVKFALLIITVPPVQPKMHIANIGITKQKSGSKTRAVVTVNVADAYGSAVSGASVSGHWSGLTSGTSTKTTGMSGTATFTSAWKSRANGIFTFTVDNMAKSGWAYDYSSNAASSASINAP